MLETMDALTFVDRVKAYHQRALQLAAENNRLRKKLNELEKEIEKLKEEKQELLSKAKNVTKAKKRDTDVPSEAGE